MISKFVNLGLTQLRRDLAYRADFLMSLFVTPTILIVNYFIWTSVFSTGTGTVAGMSFIDMMTYIVFAQLISIFIFNSASIQLQQKVQSGELGQDLLKPIHPFTTLFASAVSSRTVAFLLELIPLGAISWFLFRPALPVNATAIFFIVSLILAFMLNFIMSIIVGLIAFWTIRIEAFQWLTWIVLRVFSGEFFPLSLFPQKLQLISHFLPFEYLRYRVALIALDNSMENALAAIAGQLFWIVALGFFSLWLWDLVVRRFTIAGG